MRGRGTILIGVIAALALAGTAVGQQAVTASLEASLDERPASLPGVYEANVTVTVEAPGGQCLCQETKVELVGEGQRVEAFGFEPESYRIDWIQHALEDGDGQHERSVDAAIQVPEVDEGPVEATLDVEMEHEPNQHHLVASQTEPVTLDLDAPEEGDSQQVQAVQASSDGDEGDEEGALQAPGAGAGLAAAALVVLALAGRWR